MTNDSQTSLTVSEREARRWATICHLSALVGLLGNGVGFVLAPLIIWLIKRHDDPFIDAQGKEAVNFQITMFLALLVCVPLLLVVIGFFLGLVVLVLACVFPILAAIRAGEGENYLYPFAIRFIK